MAVNERNDSIIKYIRYSSALNMKASIVILSEILSAI